MIKNPNGDDVKHLLQECGLPHSDITPAHLQHFFASGSSSDFSGVVGVEPYGSVALLRSLAVTPKHRNCGLGKQLVAHIEQYALAQSVQVIYLLTTTADQFFSRLGYSAVLRDQAPSVIQDTIEFSHLCPSSSVLMVKYGPPCRAGII